MKKKILFVIVSGIADTVEPSPLMTTTKPNIDTLARNSFCGLLENKVSERPDSGISNFLLLGYEKEEYPGRGYFEALGANLKIIPGSVYIRANFANVKESVHDDYKTGNYEPHLIVADRGVGNDMSGLLDMSKSIKEIFLDGVRMDFHKSLGSRGVVAINSIDISPNVSDSDPGEDGKEVLQIRALKDDNASFKTAAALNKFSKEVYRILKDHPSNKYRKVPANFILLRDASSYAYIKSFRDKFGFNAACVAASPVVKGICRALEMKVDDIQGATADSKTDLRAKTMKALELLNNNDFVVMHVEGCDVASHGKKQINTSVFLERLDREMFGRLLEYANFEKIALVVCSDHPTSSKTGHHASGKMPFLIYTSGIQSNNIEKFDEKSCVQGPVIDIENFMEEVLKYTF